MAADGAIVRVVVLLLFLFWFGCSFDCVALGRLLLTTLAKG